RTGPAGLPGASPSAMTGGGSSRPHGSGANSPAATTTSRRRGPPILSSPRRPLRRPGQAVSITAGGARWEWPGRTGCGRGAPAIWRNTSETPIAAVMRPAWPVAGSSGCSPVAALLVLAAGAGFSGLYFPQLGVFEGAPVIQDDLVHEL